jgi:alcohol dehydrogenase (cytochrome c)
MRLNFRRVGVGILASVLVASTISATVSQRSVVSTQAAGSGANVDWALLGNSYDNTRYSTLDQINTSNVKSLGLAWSQQEGPNLSGWETDPIVVDGVMYYTTAVDQVRAVNAATGKLLWQYTPKVNFYQAIAGGGGGAPSNRGVTVANDVAYLLTFDDQLIALQASTGEKLWQTTVSDPKQGYSESSPVTYWNGLLFVGSEESDAGLRGFAAAFDAKTGKQVWRWYAVPKPGQGWMPAKGAHGGGAPWMPLVVDNTTGIVYIGTGNPSPDFDNSQRPGCNPWADATVALNAKTGKFIWGHTELCNDVWDYDSDIMPMLFNVTIKGKTIRAVGHANKSGDFFVYNAATGKVLAKSPYLTKYTLPHPKPSLKGSLVCPGDLGGIEYSAEAYSPETGLAYIPGLNECQTYTLAQPGEANLHKQGLPDFAGSVTFSSKLTGFFAAVDTTTGKVRWERQLSDPAVGGVVATAGGLVFSPVDDGYFYAFDAATGKTVWKAHVGLGSGAAPITYEVNGVQYIAIALGSTYSATTPPGGTLAVFKLNGTPVKTFPAVTTSSGPLAVPSLGGLIKINPYEYISPEKQSVVIKLTAAASNDNNGFNFDGYSKGKANFIVPAGWQVSWIFTNIAALPHSAALTTGLSLASVLQNGGLGPIETPNALQGVRSGSTQYVEFQATRVGKFYLLCGVPGHAQAGMWDYLTVSTTAKTPSLVLNQ